MNIYIQYFIMNMYVNDVNGDDELVTFEYDVNELYNGLVNIKFMALFY